jgi:hypothetical protein
VGNFMRSRLHTRCEVIMLALRDGVLHGKPIVGHIGPLEPEDESAIKK